MQNNIALIGLAVMGQNLALNMARNGFRVAVYNRTDTVTREFMAGPARKMGLDSNLAPCFSTPELVESLAGPRTVFLMVKAGPAVDTVIKDLLPLLDPGDIIIDGGNSLYRDSNRREAECAEHGIRFMGVGVSGGEEGALNGPSIMPGGPRDSYDTVARILKAIAARADDGTPCVDYIGPGGAGHFVKMVHNGIEYGDMQLIAETYDILARVGGLSPQQLADTFAAWNESELSSYLIEITSKIFTVMDKETGAPLVDVILDTAGQKGTGRWTTQSALDLGAATHTINAAVEARILSSFKAERVTAQDRLSGPAPDGDAPPDLNDLVETLRKALYTAKICSYAQGFAMMRAASQEYGWNLAMDSIARIWRAGCIIRARFLDDVATAFATEPDLPNLLIAEHFAQSLATGQQALRETVALAAHSGISIPALSASLAYYDGYRSARLPANLLQAQRDFFGAHTYQRTDRDGIFHTQWEA